MHEDEVHIDDMLLLQLLIDQFPHWSKLPIKRAQSAGTDNAIFRIGAKLCARLPRVEYAATNIEKEHVWLPKLAAHLPIAISKPLEKGLPHELYPFPWLICRWIDGDNAYNTPPRDLAQCATKLAEFITHLHRIDPTGGPCSRRAEALIAQDEEFQNALQRLPADINRKKLSALWEACLEAPTWNKPPVWTHGDLLPTNLLIHDAKLTAIIDFDLMGVGDPACDMIAAWSLMSKDHRLIFRSQLSIDKATWMRGVGWALSIAVIIIPYYEKTNLVLVNIARKMLNEILQEYGGSSC